MGGAKTHVISLLSGLSPHIETHLISFREGDFAGEARAAGIDVTVADDGLRSDLKMVKKMAKDYDILHCHGARANMVGMLLRKKLAKPIITTVHSDYRSDYMGRPMASLTFGMINRVALRKLDYRIGVSDVLSDMLIKRGFPAQTQYTISNGLDFNLPPCQKSRSELAAGLGIPYEEGDVLAGIAVRFDPIKDVATLIRAAARLKESCPRLRVVIAGDGKENANLRRLASELDSPVHFAGWLPGTDDFFRLIDINLLTSLSEGFPYVLTEGTRVGCATVATSVGGIPSLIDHGINGFLFNPGDDATLACLLQTLYDDPELMRETGRRLHEKARKTLSIEATIQTQLDIYQSVTRRSRRKHGRRDGITLCGAYGMDNAGDDAILESILQEIRDADPDIPVHILSRSPMDTKLAYRERAFHSFNIFSFIGAVRRSGLYLSGGGNVLQDITSGRSLWFYLFTIFVAKKLGCRVIMYGCGLGPVKEPFNRRVTASVITNNVEIITLREESSLSELERLGVNGPEIILAADPALILEPAEQEKIDSLLMQQGIPLDGSYIGFALRDWPGVDDKLSAIADAAEYAYEKYGLTPVFVPVERKQDIQTAARAAERLRCPCHILRKTGSARVTIGILGRMQAVVAMRLHALIFAAGYGLPMVGIAYNEKVNAFMDYMGQPLCTPLERLTTEILIDHIDRAVQSKDDRASRLAAVAELRAREKANRDVLARVLALPGSKGKRGQPS